MNINNHHIIIIDVIIIIIYDYNHHEITVQANTRQQEPVQFGEELQVVSIVIIVIKGIVIIL